MKEPLKVNKLNQKPLERIELQKNIFIGTARDVLLIAVSYKICIDFAPDLFTNRQGLYFPSAFFSKDCN